MVREILVLLPNQSGEFHRITKVVGDAGFNIRAFTVAESGEFTSFRLIFTEVERALDVLTKAGYEPVVAEVLAVGIKDIPGATQRIAEFFDRTKINIHHTYHGISDGRSLTPIFFHCDGVLKEIETRLSNSGYTVYNDNRDLAR